MRRGGALGRCDTTTGSGPFGQLVDQVMAQEPYRSAPRVFWVVDNGSSHRGAAACQRLQGQYPTRILVHLPTHASWLNQIELFFSILSRRLLRRGTFTSKHDLKAQLLSFIERYNPTAKPFAWTYQGKPLTK